jgi:hypothetical protein
VLFIEGRNFMRKIYLQPGLTLADIDNIQRVSPSFLKPAKRSLAHAWAAYVDPDRSVEQTDAMRIGTMLHCAILEPERFETEYVVRLSAESLPDDVKKNLATCAEDLRAMIDRYNNSKPLKLSATGVAADLRHRIEMAGTRLDPGTLEVMKAGELKAEIEAMNKSRIEPLSKSGTNSELRDRLLAAGVPVVLLSDLIDQQRKECHQRGAQIVKQEEMDLACTIRDRIRAKPVSRIMLDHPEGEYEVELAYRCPVTGIILQCRIDYLIKPCEQYPNGLVCDPKFVESAEEEAFRAAVRRYSYYIQAAFNTRAVQAVFGTEERPEFVWLAAEKESPFASKYWFATPNQIRLGDYWMDRLIPEVADCIATGVWPEYGDDIGSLEPHPYDLRILENV